MSGAQRDLVKMVFELPYMSEDMRKDFEFSTTFWNTVKEDMKKEDKDRKYPLTFNEQAT